MGRHGDFQKGKLRSRTKATRLPRVKVIVFCEGRNTEPQYLSGLRNHLKNSLLQIEIFPAQGVPLTLVKRAIQKKEELDKLARKSRNSLDKNFAVWAVFDVDDHPKVAEAKIRASRCGVEVGCSNPCFEIWLLYHMEDCDRPYHRHELQSHLRSKCKSYSVSKGKGIDFAEVLPGLDAAIVRANLGIERRNQEGDPHGNPSTTVGRLIEKLLQ